MGKEVKEWFKVIEIAEMLGFSKVSVYNKIKTINSDTLQGLQKKEKGITYYNQKAFDIIRDSFKQNDYEAAEVIEDESENTRVDIEDNKYLEKYILKLESDIEYYKEELRKNKEDIKEKDNLIKNELNKGNELFQEHIKLSKEHVKLLENEQILRRDNIKEINLLEEERAKAIDEKMNTWREEHYLEPKNKGGFFKRLFKRNSK